MIFCLLAEINRGLRLKNITPIEAVVNFGFGEYYNNNYYYTNRLRASTEINLVPQIFNAIPFTPKVPVLEMAI